MIDDTAMDQQLAAWLASSVPRGIAPDLVDDALARSRRVAQRNGLAIRVLGPGPWPTRQGVVPQVFGAPHAGALAAAAVIIVVSVVAGTILRPSKLLGPGASPSPSPTVLRPRSSLPIAAHAIPVEELGLARFEEPKGGFDVPGGLALTSSAFGIPMTFKARPLDTDLQPPDSDWCWAATSVRGVEIPYRPACAEELRILWPSAVECGGTPVALTVDAFAGVVLNNHAVGAVDEGRLEDTVWAALARQPATGRVLVIKGDHTPSTLDNPDACLVRSGDLVDELRGDVYTVLIALDVNGRLVLVRWGPGHDNPTAADARARGYGPAPLIPGYIELRIGD